MSIKHFVSAFSKSFPSLNLDKHFEKNGVKLPNLPNSAMDNADFAVEDEDPFHKTNYHCNIAWNKKREPIWVDAKKPLRAICAGSSGSGKTVVLNKFLAEWAQLGSVGGEHSKKFGAIIFNPKIVGFERFENRFHVVNHQADFTDGLQAIVDEMDRRYMYMAEHQIVDLPISDEFPHILVVIDEIYDFMNNGERADTAKRRDLVTELAQKSRQSMISMIVAGQTINTEALSTQIRNQLDYGFCLRTNSDIQTSLVVKDGLEKYAPCHKLPTGTPGLGYFYTHSTEFNTIPYEKGRGYFISDEDVSKIMDMYADDKPQLDWFPFKPIHGAEEFKNHSRVREEERKCGVSAGPKSKFAGRNEKKTRKIPENNVLSRR